MAKQPNFLFFITDQHRADHLGCYGNPIVRTPVLDALSKRGWTSDEFHVATPICMPNRASLMTGRMPSRHGVRHNGIELSLDETVLPEVLRQAGYATAHVGKSHLQNIEVKPPQIPKPGEPKLARQARREGPGLHGQEVWKRWEDQPEFDITTPFYGFESVDLCIHHADEEFGHWRRWLRSQVKDADKLVGPENAIPTPEIELARCRQAWRTRVPEELYPTSWIADRAIARLREAKSGGKPFFMHCSFPDPHHPYTPPGKYWDMYRPEDVPAPASYHAKHVNLPPHIRHLYGERESGKALKNTQAIFACSEREAREAIALNYGSISLIDHSIGRVLAELDALGLAEDTIVVFTADHADFMGDHQLLLKGPIHYRGLTRVPFIWADPAGAGTTAEGAKGTRSAAFAQTIDISATILARAGVEAWNGLQGRSLLPLMDGSKAAVRESMVIEEEGQRFYMGFPDRVRARTLLHGTARVTLYDGVAWGELYDRASDPDECHNLWDEPGSKALRAEMTERLARAMVELSETSPYPTAIA